MVRKFKLNIRQYDLKKISALIIVVLSIGLFSLNHFGSNSKAVNTVTNFPYTGAVQTYTVPATGTYKLEVWGAQGGYDYDTTIPGGTGGYSKGEIDLIAGTTLYIYSGSSGAYDMPINGGGQAGRGTTGGDASDIRIGANSLYARVIVAGGGGANGLHNGPYGALGGVGGGMISGDGEDDDDFLWAGCLATGGHGGSATGGGAGGEGCNSGSDGDDGEFGFGGYADSSCKTCRPSGGGGGWYGGGGGSDNNAEGGSAGGGGSGFVYTSATAANVPASGWLLNSSHYLSNAETIAGDQSFDDPNGNPETGHLGDGFARITPIESMTVTGITPDNGPTAGGANVTINGTNFSQFLDFNQISAGDYHTCAIASDNKAYCWGHNNRGQLGNDSNTDSYIPVAVDTSGILSSKTIKQISVGTEYTCVIASDDKAYCWGYNNFGQLGNNSTTASNIPVAVDTSGVLSGKTIKQISSGFQHTCVIASDDQAYCWGSNSSGQLGNNSTIVPNTPVAVDTSGVLSGKTIKQVSAGVSHTCAIASDDQAYCWGSNSVGQLGNSSNITSLIPVTVNTSGVLSGKTIKQISVGNNYTCAIASDDKAYCWGNNLNYGNLGNNSFSTNSNIPVAVDTSGVLSGKTIKQISAFYTHTCTIASDDNAYCWGAGTSGKLGNDSGANSSVPVAVDTSGVLSGKTVKQISVGISHTCAIASDDKVYCWGGGPSNYGQLGNNSTTASRVPVAVTMPDAIYTVTFDMVNTPLATCTDVIIVNSTTITCKTPAHAAGLVSVTIDNGIDPPVILADSYTYQAPQPLMTVTGITPNNGLTAGGTDVIITGADFNQFLDFKQVSAGTYHTCAIASDEKAYCWGYGVFGQLGNNSVVNSYVPVAVDMSGALYGKTIKQVSVSNAHTCALASDDSVYCWGSGSGGRLGNNSTANSSVPVAVDTSGVLSGKTIKQISVGTYHTCIIASDNKAYCWGFNDGRLGNNSTTNSSVPVAVDTSGVLSGKTIKQISAGEIHTCAIASDDEAYCWGQNNAGQFGNNSTANSSVPVAVDTSGVLSGKTIKQISAGYNTCIIASDDKAYCWGNNTYGQLGNNSTISSSIPVAVDTSGVLSGKTIKQISAGRFYTCVIASDDEAYCWGQDDYGQFGNNSATSSNTPVAVDASGAISGETIKYISAGETHTCAIVSDDKTYCWGNNTYGKLGNNSTTDSYVPIAVIMPNTSYTITFDIANTPLATCTDVIVVNSTTITCKTPAHVAGLVSVTVSNGVGSATLPAEWADTGTSTSTNQTVSNIQSGFLYIEPYVSLSLDTNNLNIGNPSLTPTTSGAFASAANILTIKTNNPTGYSLNLSTNTTDNNLHHLSLSGNIPATTGTWSTKSAIGTNKWGFTLNTSPTDSAAIWSAVPNNSSPLTVKSTTTADEGNTGSDVLTTINYGAKIDVTQVAGIYNTTVVYTAIANP